MLKATIQAENLGDLAAAAATLQQAINDPKQLDYRLPVALNKMADWQLTIAGDPEAARRTLHQIQRASTVLAKSADFNKHRRQSAKAEILETVRNHPKLLRLDGNHYKRNIPI